MLLQTLISTLWSTNYTNDLSHSVTVLTLFVLNCSTANEGLSVIQRYKFMHEHGWLYSHLCHCLTPELYLCHL